MKLWFQWGLLLVGWMISSYSLRIWPHVTQLNMEVTPDFWSALLYRPFHYIVGFMGMLFFVLITIHLIKKFWYELKVALLFRSIPYEVLILFSLLLLIYLKAILSLFYLTLGLTIAIAVYEIIAYLPNRKKEVVFVRE